MVTDGEHRPLAGVNRVGALAAIGGPLAGTMPIGADVHAKADQQKLGNMITKLAQPNPAASGCMLTIIKTTGLVGRTPRAVVVTQTLMICREPGP